MASGAPKTLLRLADGGPIDSTPIDEVNLLPISDIKVLLSSMEPILHPGAYAFATLPDGSASLSRDIIAAIQEWAREDVKYRHAVRIKVSAGGTASTLDALAA